MIARVMKRYGFTIIKFPSYVKVGQVLTSRGNQNNQNHPSNKIHTFAKESIHSIIISWYFIWSCNIPNLLVILQKLSNCKLNYYFVLLYQKPFHLQNKESRYCRLANWMIFSTSSVPIDLFLEEILYNLYNIFVRIRSTEFICNFV